MKRLWGIRHVRYWLLRRRLSLWLSYCQQFGLGLFANPSDVEYLDRVWRGEA